MPLNNKVRSVVIFIFKTFFLIRLISEEMKLNEIRPMDLTISVTNEFCFMKDVSANISRDLRKREKKGFWKEDYQKHVLKFYAENPKAHFKNLFSILMYDWHEKDEKSSKNYFLVDKFLHYQLVSRGTTMFEKLFEIIESEKIYFRICLKILYYFVQEAIEEYDLTSIARYIIPKIRKKISNEDFRNEIFKVFIMFSKYSNDEEYNKMKKYFTEKGNERSNGEIN